MNHSRIRSVDDLQRGDHTLGPNKRMRVASPEDPSAGSSTPDEIANLNATGMNILHCDPSEAERCFSQALSLGNKFSRPAAKVLSSGPATLERSPRLSSSPCTKGLNTHTDKTKMLYIYQRQEYDEGMYAYSEALPIEENLSDSLRSATLMYNVGQTHVRRAKYFEARKWFELAMVRLRLDPIPNEHAPMYFVRVFHNLGHCLYRLGKNEDAMRCYQKALAQVQQAKLGSYHEAVANNCLAVLLFHNNVDSVKALELFQQTLSEYRKHLGNESREVATVLNNIGRVHYLNSNYDQALQVYEEGLVIRRKILGPESIGMYKL
jgi:tetratricopeptide (TPR) repeat protein